jgi:hypothetical protein
MSSLTREQAKTWNNGNENGFKFDSQYYLFHGEKTSKKIIDLGNKNLLVIHLMYRNEYETRKNAYGQSFSVPTGKQTPVMHMSIYLDQGSMMVSHGLGYWQDLGDAVPRKNYDLLKTRSCDLDDAACLAMFENLSKTQVNKYA